MASALCASARLFRLGRVLKGHLPAQTLHGRLVACLRVVPARIAAHDVHAVIVEHCSLKQQRWPGAQEALIQPNEHRTHPPAILELRVANPAALLLLERLRPLNDIARRHRLPVLIEQPELAHPLALRRNVSTSASRCSSTGEPLRVNGMMRMLPFSSRLITAR